MQAVVMVMSAAAVVLLEEDVGLASVEVTGDGEEVGEVGEE